MPKWFEINAESKKELEQWDVEFDSKLFRMGERVLLDEEMVQKTEEYCYHFRDAVFFFFFFFRGDSAEISHKGRLRTR